jgi:hypothetical protein
LTNKCNELQVYLDTESPDIIGLCLKILIFETLI